MSKFSDQNAGLRPLKSKKCWCIAPISHSQQASACVSVWMWLGWRWRKSFPPWSWISRLVTANRSPHHWKHKRNRLIIYLAWISPSRRRFEADIWGLWRAGRDQSLHSTSLQSLIHGLSCCYQDIDTAKYSASTKVEGYLKHISLNSMSSILHELSPKHAST